jgi:hypothetical protein
MNGPPLVYPQPLTDAPRLRLRVGSPPVRFAAIALLAAFALIVAGCGEGDGVGEGKLADALRLEETGEGEAMNGDLFCQVSEILSDADEVEAAIDADAPVVLNKEQTLGIEVVTPFAPDCEERARKALNRLERETE